jgi:hypothetical protein
VAAAVAVATAASGAGVPAVAPALTIASGIVADPGSISVAANARGQYVVAWVGANGLYARRGTVGGALGATQLLAAGGLADEPIFSTLATAIAPDGTAVVGWDRTIAAAGQLQTAVAPPGRPFGATQTLAQKQNPRPGLGPNPLPGLHLAAADGRIVALWFRVRPANQTQLYDALAGGDGRFGAAVTLALAGAPVAPNVVALRSGTFVAEWSIRPPATPVERSAEAILAPAAAAFAAPRIMAPAGTAAGDEGEVSLSPPGSGAATVALVDAIPGASGQHDIQVAVLRPGGGAPMPAVAGQIRGPAADVWDLFGPVAAAPGGGDTLVAWAQSTYPPGKSQSPTDLFVALAAPGSSFAAPLRLLTTSDEIMNPLAAATAGSSAVLVWPQFPRPAASTGYNYTQERVMFSEVSPGAAPSPPTPIATTAIDGNGPLDVVSLASAGPHAIAAVLDARTGMLSLYAIAP